MHSIPVYLVVGALGSGKTTLLKRVVNVAGGRNFLYLVNEFSAVDVDVGQIEKEGGVAVALAGGSMFSRSLAPAFISLMKQVSAGVPFGVELVRPDAVVIEASSMTDPRSMTKLLSNSGLSRDFHLAGVTAVVNPGILMKLLLFLPNIRGQIQCADLIIFNKMDLHSPEVVESVKDRVRSINNNAGLLCCTQCDFDAEMMLNRVKPDGVERYDTEGGCKGTPDECELLVFEGKPAIREFRELFSEDSDGLQSLKGCVECLDGWYFMEWVEDGFVCHKTRKQRKSALMLVWNPEKEPSLIAKLRYLAF